MNQIYHTTQKWLAQSYMKSLTLIPEQLFKNQTLDQILKQIYLSKVMGNIQYSFSIDQLEKLEEIHLNRMSKYNADVKDKY